MTPNEIVAALRGHGFRCEISNTGGNCGAILVDGVPYGELMVTTESGPWATPNDDDHDRGEGWVVSWHDEREGGTWVDGDLVRDGDAVFTVDALPVAVARVYGFAVAHHVP